MKNYLEILEYDKLKAIIKQYIQTTYGINALNNLKPVFDIEKAKQDFAILNEFFDFFYKWGSFALDDIYITPIIKDAFSGILNEKELMKIGNFLSMLKQIENSFTEHDSHICEYHISFDIPDELLDEINRAIDDHGFIKDSATGYLYELRSQIKELKEDIVRSLKNIIHSRTREIISDTAVFLRHSRYTLLVKPNFKEYLRGRIIDMAKAGGFFVEPDTIYESNNKLEELILKEEAEKRKILTKITNLVRKNSSRLMYNEKRLGFFDLEVAKFNYAKNIEQADINFVNKPILFAKNVKHPILAHIKKDTKSVNIDLKNDSKLIITGPNTGGKTVFLKTIGLVVLSVFSNIPPIGSYVEIGNFSSVFAVIGDEQDIFESLSGFSAKMIALKNLYNKINKNSLVLLDEIGGGTSPEEGESVAYSIIKNLTNKCSFVITTHYKKLAYILFYKNYPTAAFEFDKETLRPTYKLTYGQIGQSYAPEILKTLNMPKDIVDTATDFYKNNETRFSKLEKELEEQLTKLHKKEDKYNKLKTEYKELIENEKQMKEKLYYKISQEEKENREIYENLIAKLQQEINSLLKEKNISQTHKELSQIKKESQNIFSNIEQVEQIEPLHVNNTVRFNNMTGKIINIRGKKALVEIDGKGIEVMLSSLTKEHTKKEEKQVAVNAVKNDEHFEINLIGKRRYDAEIELVKFLDSSIVSSMKTIRIIHGIGSGVLKEMVKEVLKNHPYVKSFHPAHPNEGGAGATIAEFK